jgi:hypothetical protein
MGTMPPAELLRLWQQEKLTAEMAVGYIIQNLVNLQRSIDASNTGYFTLRADVDALAKQEHIRYSPRQKKS